MDARSAYRPDGGGSVAGDGREGGQGLGFDEGEVDGGLGGAQASVTLRPAELRAAASRSEVSEAMPFPR